MKDLVIDVSRLVGRRLRKRLPTGIDRVGLAYLRHYGDRAQAALVIGSRAIVLPRDASRRVFDQLLLPVGEAGMLPALIHGAVRSPVRADVAGAWFLNTGHTGLHRPGYEAMLRHLGVRPLFVVHDLIPITHPQYCRAPEAALHSRRMALAVRTAAAAVCNSSATFDDLADFAQRLGVTLPPVAVAPLAAEPVPPIEDESRPLADPYFLMLGTIEPRKNHMLVLHVWQRLAKRLGERTPPLVLVGQPGWECEHVMRMLERAPALRRHVQRHEHCSDADLHRWLRHAQALLFPSFTEGFGLPVLEALLSGVPVIAADLPVYREFAGNHPEYLDPLDVSGWIEAVDAYRDSGNRRRTLRVEALAGFRGPTWADHFDRVDDLMQRIDLPGRAGAPTVRRTTAVASAAAPTDDGGADD
jgi:glycosyltransferase involved in cell wall biosynthesis